MIKNLLIFLASACLTIALLLVASVMTSGKAKAQDVPYLSDFYRAEQMYNLPHNLLVEVARQESDFNPDIIYCRIQGPVDEWGIMQLREKYFRKENACSPDIAIYLAAQYLKALHIRFGFWNKALQAYNWGPTNVAAGGVIPKSVIKYSSEILDRVYKSQAPVGVYEN